MFIYLHWQTLIGSMMISQYEINVKYDVRLVYILLICMCFRLCVLISWLFPSLWSERKNTRNCIPNCVNLDIQLEEMTICCREDLVKIHFQYYYFIYIFFWILILPRAVYYYDILGRFTNVNSMKLLYITFIKFK